MMTADFGKINVSVANIYRDSTFKSEMVSQGVLNEGVEVLGRSEKFIRVRQADGYVGWIDEDQIWTDPAGDLNLKTVRWQFLKIHESPDDKTIPVRDAVIGCRLSCVDEKENWYQILLPDNRTGWAWKEGFGTFPDFSAEAALRLAYEFLGYQYCWGGKTPKGLDCSGFVQLVFSLLGKSLPRDAWMQQKASSYHSGDFLKAKPSDLLFFGTEKRHATHVGISLGAGRLVHAKGFVRINSLKKGDMDFNPELKETFISVNRLQGVVP